MKVSWVEIHLDRLESNIRALREALPERTDIIFVVKADAYGHGTGPVARRAVQAGVQRFAVAYFHEARNVREAIGKGPEILIVGVSDAEDVPEILEKNLTPIVVSEAHAEDLSSAAQREGVRLPVHFKIDTGMGRLGVYWTEALEAGKRILQMPGLKLEGLCSHFAAVKPEKPTGAQTQVERFTQVADALDAEVGYRLFRHMSSSRAAMLKPEWDFDAIRPGIILFGYGATDPRGRACTQPILEWKTHLVQVRSVPADFPVGYYSTYRTEEATQLGVIALGYADGYLRTLSNRGHVLVGGRRCPVVGRVSMNWICVDLGPDNDARAGDEAVLIGEQNGASIWADELAVICRTIPYEILTNIRSDIERRYVG